MTVAFADDLMHLSDEIEQAAMNDWKTRVMMEYHDVNTGVPQATPWMNKDQISKQLGIHDAFQPWSLLPDPDAFQPVADKLSQAMGLLRVDADFSNPVDPSDQIGAARQEYQALVGHDPISNWSGATADNFRNKFLDHFKANTENQAILIAVLKAAADAQRAIWTNARHDITSIAQNALAAVRSGGYHPNPLVMGLTVLAGIASIAAVPFSGGGSLALGITAIGAAGSIASTGVGQDPVTLTGHSVPEIIKSMKSGIVTLQDSVTTACRKVEVSLLDNLVVVGLDAQQLFAMAKPTLATNDPGLIAGR